MRVSCACIMVLGLTVLFLLYHIHKGDEKCIADVSKNAASSSKRRPKSGGKNEKQALTPIAASLARPGHNIDAAGPATRHPFDMRGHKDHIGVHIHMLRCLLKDFYCSYSLNTCTHSYVNLHYPFVFIFIFV